MPVAGGSPPPCAASLLGLLSDPLGLFKKKKKHNHRYGRKRPLQMLQTVSPPEPAAFFSGFRGVSNPLPPLQTAGNSASFSGGAAPNSDPAPLRRLLHRAAVPSHWWAPLRRSCCQKGLETRTKPLFDNLNRQHPPHLFKNQINDRYHPATEAPGDKRAMLLFWWAVLFPLLF